MFGNKDTRTDLASSPLVQEQMQPQDAVYGNYEEERQGVVLETEEMNKWEMDTIPMIDRWKHEMLGEHQVNGEWKVNPNVKPTMNEEGAHFLSMMIYARGNIHTQMSEFQKEDIINMSADAGEDAADLLYDNWRQWGVSHSRAIHKAIANMIFHMVYSLLLISLKGGMRKHRERRGVKTMFSQPQAMQGVM